MEVVCFFGVFSVLFGFFSQFQEERKEKDGRQGGRKELRPRFHHDVISPSNVHGFSS